MKKFLAIMLSVISAFAVLSFSACGKKPNGNLSVYAPDGAPALAIAGFINDGYDFGTGAQVEYNVIAANALNGVVGSGDIIVMPINLATKSYNKNAEDPYKMAGVITHGNLYVMAKSEISLEDLKGQVVGVANLSNVPGLTFKAVLSANGINCEASDTADNPNAVALKDYSASELKTALQTGNIDVGVLAEPTATELISAAPEFVAIDLQQLYDGEKQAYPQAVVMVKSSVIANYPHLIEKFAEKTESKVTWVKNNPAAALNALAGVRAEGIVPSFTADNLTSAVVDKCKIYWQSAADAKTEVNAYINKIRLINVQAANEVGEDFFA